MQIIYQDKELVVCVKPAGVLSTDEPGGLPDLLRQELGTRDFRTVHRLDRVVSGLMVLCRNAPAAAELSRQIREGEFEKSYLAVVHGQTEREGTLIDLLARDKAERKTYVVTQPGKDAREAILHYETLDRNEELSLVRIRLVTGRTHQIRCQFSHRGWPLVGDRKYSLSEDGCDIALWSYSLSFYHPVRGEPLRLCQRPPEVWPWTKVNIS